MKKIYINESQLTLLEDYPQSFNMQYFKTLKSFNAKINYCNNELQKLGSGSSRIIYKIDEQKVLKLAKNKKGLAQNESEFDNFKHSYFGEYVVAKVFDVDDNYAWIEMELAYKVTPAQFKTISGISFQNFSDYLAHEIFASQGKKYFKTVPEEVIEEGANNEFASYMLDFATETDLAHGDLTRISSYGQVIRNGSKELVIVDYGATNSIIQNYYSR